MPAYIRLVSAMKRSGALSYVDSVDFEASGNSLLTLSRNRNVINKTSLHLHTVKSPNYEGRTESYEQLFFACELGTSDEGECGGRWNQLLCYS